MENKHKFRLIAFGLLALIQIAIPLSMISSLEAVVLKGSAYKFRTAPVDPYDPFRGKYVSLRFDMREYCSAIHPALPEKGDIAYILLSTDSAGFASIAGIQTYMPQTEGEDWLEVAVDFRYIHDDSTSACFGIDLPFDRFYMEEKKAPAAERAYWDANASDSLDCWAMVKVRDGEGVIENLYINELPINKWVELHAED